MVSTSVRYTPEAGVSCLPLASARVLGGRYALATTPRLLGGRYALATTPRLLGGRVRVLLEQSLRHAGKLMRIRTFYYLPPKAGFNWRGPARR